MNSLNHQIPKFKINNSDIVENTGIKHNNNNNILSYSHTRHKSYTKNHLSSSLTNNIDNCNRSRRHTISSSFDLNGLPKLTLLNSIDLPIFDHSSPNLKNIDIINHYLLNAGFLPSKIIYNNNIVIRLATTSNDVFIPTISSNEEEYLSRLNSSNNNNNNNVENIDMNDVEELVDYDLSNMSTNSDTENDVFSLTSSVVTGSGRSRSDSTRRSSVSFLRQDIGFPLPSNFNRQNSSTLINPTNNNHPNEITMNNNNLCYFKIAVIVSINENTRLESIQLELSSRVKIKYLNGESQFIKVGQLDWNLNKYNFNLFLPEKLKSIDTDAIENFDNIIHWKLFKNVNYKKRPLWSNDPSHSDFWKSSLFQRLGSLNQQTDSFSSTDDAYFTPGDYVFLIPIIFNNHIPETISYPSGKLDYFIRLASFKKDIQMVPNGSSTTTIQTSNKDPTTSSISKDQEVLNISPSQPSLNNLSIFQKMKNRFRSSSITTTTTSVTTTINTSVDTGYSSFTRTYTSDSNSSSYSKTTGQSIDIADLNIDKDSIPKTDLSYVVNEIYLQKKLNVVRTPPLLSVSTANKPVYINKIWDNSLNYEISLPNKYIPLDANIPITVKLSPLIKNLSLIKFAIGVSERIGYVNNKDKNMSFKETDHILRDSSNPYYYVFNSKKKKERLLLLYELRSEQTGPRALREEIVTNCIDNNLLSYYRTKSDDNSRSGNGDMIIEPIELHTVLKFPSERAYVLSDNDRDSVDSLKNVDPPYGIESYDVYDSFDNLESFYPTTPNGTLPDIGNMRDRNRRKNSIVNFFFGRESNSSSSSNRSNSNIATNGESRTSNSVSNEGNENLTHKRFKTQINVLNKKNIAMINTKMYNPKRGLYIDSSHFSTIRCKHKLEIIMKFEKYDENKLLRQYEVVVNTPIFLMSRKCTNENLILPIYDINGNTYYQPNKGRIDSLSSLSVPAPLYPPLPPPTFEESLSNPLVSKNTLNYLYNNNSNNNRYTYRNNFIYGNNGDLNSNYNNSNSIPKTSFYLNTEFGNLDDLMNNYTRFSHYRRVSVGSNKLTPPLERIPSPPPAYVDVFPPTS